MDTLQLRLASEPRRLQILELIWDRELSAGEIAERVPVSFAAVSQHLAKLREAGLVSVRRDGRYRFYAACKQDMGTLAVLLEAMWAERLGVLKRMAEAAEAERGDNRPADPDHKKGT
ncbi:MAG: metalloregulator ArsR/SmtB family transcription factor [Gemmatimonadota bacterium]|nr:metalloregulator ArsR/SmtB family transcription factor [Gemmatimonadota bacterium]